MTTNIALWQSSYTTIDQQVKTFKSKMLDASLSLQELDEIIQKIRPAAIHIEGLNQALQQKNEELKRNCCKRNSPEFILGSLTAIVLGGQYVSLYFTKDSEASQQTKNIAFWVNVVATTFNGFLTYYGNKMGLDTGRQEELEKLVEQGAEYAHKFEQFLTTFKEIKIREDVMAQFLARSRSASKVQNTSPKDEQKVDSAPHVTIDIVSASSTPPQTHSQAVQRHSRARLSESASSLEEDEEDSDLLEKCIGFYEALPERFKDVKVLSMIFSTILRTLPEDDPLRTQLQEIKSSGKVEVNPNTPVQSALITNYLSPAEINPNDPVEWKGEAAAFGMQSPQMTYKEQWNSYNKRLRRRFRALHPISLPFLLTPEGALVTQNGMVYPPKPD
jgi:hypothetical protein